MSNVPVPWHRTKSRLLAAFTARDRGPGSTGKVLTTLPALRSITVTVAFIWFAIKPSEPFVPTPPGPIPLPAAKSTCLTCRVSRLRMNTLFPIGLVIRALLAVPEIATSFGREPAGRPTFVTE